MIDRRIGWLNIRVKEQRGRYLSVKRRNLFASIAAGAAGGLGAVTAFLFGFRKKQKTREDLPEGFNLSRASVKKMARQAKKFAEKKQQRKNRNS